MLVRLSFALMVRYHKVTSDKEKLGDKLRERATVAHLCGGID